MSYSLVKVTNPVLSGSDRLTAPPKSELFKKFSALTTDPVFYRKIMTLLPQDQFLLRIQVQVKLTKNRVKVIINGKKIQFSITEQNDETRRTQRVVNNIFKEATSPTLPVRSRRRSSSSSSTIIRTSSPCVIQTPPASPKSDLFSSVKPLPSSPVSSLSSHSGFAPPNPEKVEPSIPLPLKPSKFSRKRKTKGKQVERSNSSLSEKPAEESWLQKIRGFFSSKKKPKVTPQLSIETRSSQRLPGIDSASSETESSGQSFAELTFRPKSPTRPQGYSKAPLNSPMLLLEEIR